MVVDQERLPLLQYYPELVPVMRHEESFAFASQVCLGLVHEPTGEEDALPNRIPQRVIGKCRPTVQGRAPESKRFELAAFG